MLIRRNEYLARLIQARENGLIKIITGLRRVGKSWLLFRLFARHLIDSGMPEEHVIRIDLEDRRNAMLRDPDALLAYVDSRTAADSPYCVLIDEIQHVPEFEDVLNSIVKNEKIDLYVTGSNSRFLSTDIATIFRGRSDQVHVRPLSFSEFLPASGLSRAEAWKDYYTYGGLPHILSLRDDEQKIGYLRALRSTVYLADIVERYHLKGSEGMEEVLRVCASGIGAFTNPNRIANTFRNSRKSALTYKTIDNYLNFLGEAFLTEKALRYDIKGRKYINALAKYYFTDVGIRNSILDFRQQEESHVMENIIYNELRGRGYLVDVGIVSQRTTEENREVTRHWEVDFVANMGSRRYYIQSALALPTEEKRRQETESLRRIGDSFRKVIIARDDVKPSLDESGILTIGLFDFLLGKASLD